MSLSKNQKDLISTYGDVDAPPMLLASISTVLWLYERWISFVVTVTKRKWGPYLRKAAGACACAVAAVYVAGYACGYWLRNLITYITK